MATRNKKRDAQARKKANQKPKTSSAKRKTKSKAQSQKESVGIAKRIVDKLKKAFQSLAKFGRRVTTKVTVIRGPKEVDSSWLDVISYIQYGRQRGVAVKFLSGVEVFYQNTSINDYQYLRDASSKGRAIHNRFYDLPYQIIN